MKKVMIAILSMAIMLSVPMRAVSSDSDTWISGTAYQACVEYGKSYGIQPEFLMSIIETESAGKPYVSNGQCKGLMQVSERYHANRMAKLGVTNLYDERGNILVATDYLRELFEEYGEASYVLDVYNGNSKARYNYENGILSDYARKVLERSHELEDLHYGNDKKSSVG